MHTWLVQVLVMSQRNMSIRQEQVLACGAACYVSGGSIAVQARMDTLLVQVFVISQGSDPLIGWYCLVEVLVMLLVALDLFR